MRRNHIITSVRLNAIALDDIARYLRPTAPGLASADTGTRDRTQDVKPTDIRADRIFEQDNRPFGRSSSGGSFPRPMHSR